MWEVSTSVHNWSVSKMLVAATWRPNSVFTSFYRKIVRYVNDICRYLGPFVAAEGMISLFFFIFSRIKYLISLGVF